MEKDGTLCPASPTALPTASAWPEDSLVASACGGRGGAWPLPSERCAEPVRLPSLRKAEEWAPGWVTPTQPSDESDDYSTRNTL